MAPGGRETVKANVDWLVCKETCIPESVELALTLPVAAAAGPDPTWAAPIEAARRALPRPLTGWQASAAGQGSSIVLTLVPPAGTGEPGTLRFFPYAEREIEPSVPQKLTREGDAYRLVLPVANDFAGSLPRLAGVLTASGSLGGDVAAATLDLPLAGNVVAGAKPALAAAPKLNLAPPPAPPADLALGLAALFALLGGVLLNLMPCVFPVLSIKVLGFATHHDRPSTLRREAVAYATGVVLTFVALGLGLFALRAAGEELGWGFQLQSPAVVSLLAALFFVLALNLSGVFEFGQFAPAGLAGLTARNRSLDALLSGVLAVVVASPCTAPFMGAALGFALAGSAWVTLLVFAALGVGMALPYVLLAWFPAWRGWLPRSGPWLGRFKQLLAYPLYATVIWLVWVLGAQLDNDGVRPPAAGAARHRFRALGVADPARRRLEALDGSDRRRRGRGCRRGLAAADHRQRGPGAGDVHRRRGIRGGRVARLLAGPRCRALRKRSRGVRRFHRRVVRDLPGEQAPGAQRCRRARGLCAQEGGAGAGRLDPARSRDHPGADRVGQERGPRLRAVPARQGTSAAAGGLATTDRAGRAGAVVASANGTRGRDRCAASVGPTGYKTTRRRGR